MLRFTESFEMHDSDHQLEKWTGRFANYTDDYYAAAGGRFGSGGWNGIYSGRYFWKTFVTADDEWVIGCAVRFDTAAMNSNYKLFSFRDTVSSEQVELRTNGNKLVATRAGTLLATGTTTLVTGVWYYIEFKVKIHNSTGTVEARLDGNVEFAVSGIDTQATANASADTLFMLDDTVFAGNISLDDIYLLDGTDSGIAGNPNNDFLGDVRVQAVFPSGNGTTSALDGSDGNTTDNYLLVDESNPNGDTDYVESPDVGDKDTYAFGDVAPANGNVYGLILWPYVRKTDAGTRKVKGVVRSGGVEDDGPEYGLSASWQYLPFARDGDTSDNAWTISTINAVEAGLKVTT